MLKPIEISIKSWDWKAQTIGEGESAINISNIINRIEAGYYKTRKTKLNLEVYNLGDDSFKCDNLFQFLTHYKLVENAKMEYPIIINSIGQVIDGRHRICKAILLGKKNIKAIQILDSTVI